MLDDHAPGPAITAPPADERWRMAARDTLHGVATFYLRHSDSARALTLLLTALHLARATRPLLLATALAFLQVRQPEQALAAIERAARDFGPSRSAMILKARAVMQTEGMAAGQAVMQEALAMADDGAAPLALPDLEDGPYAGAAEPGRAA